jgi:Luciferase-like monooxygenase
MIRYGYFLSCEEYSPAELVRQAKLADEAGFDGLWISDHYHPWLDDQGESGFVWSLIGAISQVTSLPVTTAVTCPLLRQHPAVVALARVARVVVAAQLDLAPRRHPERHDEVGHEAKALETKPHPWWKAGRDVRDSWVKRVPIVSPGRRG